MGRLKGKNSLMLYGKLPELKCKCRNREFRRRGLRGRGRGNAKKIYGDIQRRHEQDKAGEKLAIQASKKPVCERQATELCGWQSALCAA